MVYILNTVVNDHEKRYVGWRDVVQHSQDVVACIYLSVPAELLEFRILSRSETTNTASQLQAMVFTRSRLLD